MNPMNQRADLDARYRTLLILWFALFASIGMFFLLTVLTTPATATENNALSLALLVVGSTFVLASYFVKRRFLAQSVARQDMGLVQQGIIVAAALSEVAAMLGLLDHFLTGHPYYYVLIIISAIGYLLNFPRREHLLSASYKKDLS